MVIKSLSQVKLNWQKKSLHVWKQFVSDVSEQHVKDVVSWNRLLSEHQGFLFKIAKQGNGKSLAK